MDFLFGVKSVVLAHMQFSENNVSHKLVSLVKATPAWRHPNPITISCLIKPPPDSNDMISPITPRVTHKSYQWCNKSNSVNHHNATNESSFLVARARLLGTRYGLDMPRSNVFFLLATVITLDAPSSLVLRICLWRNKHHLTDSSDRRN